MILPSIGPVPSLIDPQCQVPPIVSLPPTPRQSSTSAEQPCDSRPCENDATDQLGPSGQPTIANRAASSSYQIGYQRGKQLKDQILNQLRQIADLAGSTRGTLVIPDGAIKDPASYFSADQLDELRGMADAVHVPLGNIVAHHFANAFTVGSGPMQTLPRPSWRPPNGTLMMTI